MTSSFVHHELPNGLRVVCETMPHVNSVAAGFLIRTGSRHETPEVHGVSHFLEHMCFKGTATRSCHDINIRFDELGSIYNAFTSKEHTFYHGWVPADQAEEQIELLADMMRPALKESDFEMERNVILEEIAQSDDSFDRHVSAFLHEQLFGAHPLSHEVLGEKETIAGLPLERMVEYHARRYSADNVVLIVAGNVEAERTFAEAGRRCGTWQRSGNGNATGTTNRTDPSFTSTIGKQLPPFGAGVRKLHLPQFQQQALVLLYPSVPQGDIAGENIEAFSMLFGGPNSRCYWNIVQKGISTSAGAAWIAYADCGYMALYAYGEPDRCEEMLKALRSQADEVRRDGFKAAEVERVRNHRRTQLALEAETPRSRLSQIMDDLECFGHVRTPAARLAEADAVTSASIAEYLRRHPITGEGLLLSMGPRNWP